MDNIISFLKGLFGKNTEVVVPQEPVTFGKVLSVTYNTQRDNKHRPGGSCNVTSVQMCLSLGSKVTDDELFERANSKAMQDWVSKRNPHIYDPQIQQGNLNIVWDVLEKIARDEIGVEYAKHWEPGLSWDLFKAKLIAEIEQGYPIVVGGRFTASGHIIAIVGYNENGFVCHDPYGVAPDYTNHNGAYVTYGYDYMKAKLSTRHLFIHADRRIPIS